MKALTKTLLLIIFAMLALAGCNRGTPNIPFLNSPTPTLTNTPTPTSTSTPSPTPTNTPTPTITPTPTQIGGGSGKVIFGYTREGFESEFPDLEGKENVFIADLDGSNLTPVTNGLRGYNTIEALSPDGSKVLISSFTSWNRKNDARGILYVYDLNNLNAEPVKIVQGFSQNSYSPAAGWINDTEIVYIGTGEKGYGIYRTNISGAEPIKIDITVKKIERILAIDGEYIYWSSVEHRNYPLVRGPITFIWWTKLDGAEQGKLEVEGRQVEYYSTRYAFSPDKKKLAWLSSAPEPECDSSQKVQQLWKELSTFEYAEKCELLYLIDLDNPNSPIKIPLAYPRMPSDQYYEHSKYGIVELDQVAWSPTKDKLFGLFGGRLGSLRGGWASPKMYTFFVSNKNIELMRDFPSIHEYNYFEEEGKTQGRYWPSRIYGYTPDGKQMLVRKITDEDTPRFILVNLETMTLDEMLLNNLNHEEINSIFIMP